MRHFFRHTVPLLVILSVPASPAFAQAERIDPIPFGPKEIVKALSPFRGDPDSSKVAKLLGEQAEKSGFPSTDLDYVLVARLWRRAGQTELAMAALEQMGGDSDAANLAMYEAARVLLESGMNQRGGRQAYWLACGAVDERVRAEIEWDLLPVSTPEEREAWETVPARENCDWLRDFWDERAQRMIVSSDERIAIHFRRITEARRMYYLAKPRFLHGMSNAHGRPDGLAVDDRGLLFMRLGRPDNDESCAELVPSPADTFPNLLGRCWAYEGPRGYQLFYLTTTDRFGQTRPDGDFRIQEDLGQLAEPGTQFFYKYVMNADISDATKTELIRGGARFRSARLARLAPRSSEGWVAALDAIEFRANRSRIRLDLRRITSDVLEQVPDTPDLALTVDLRFETLRFLNPSSRKWIVWFLGAVPARQLQPSDGDNPESTLNIGGRFSVMTADGMRIEQITPLSIPVSAVTSDAGISLRGSMSVDPGPLSVSFVIEDLNAPGTGAWIHDTVNVPSVRGLPQLSDIAVAQSEGGTWTRDGFTFLQLSPVHNTNPDGSIHTYFEVYGIRSGTEYDVEVRLIDADKAERIWRLQSKDVAFRLQFRSQMSGEIGRHHLRLELRDTKPGEYTLAVRIQNADTGAYSLPTITDLFVAE